MSNAREKTEQILRRHLLFEWTAAQAEVSVKHIKKAQGCWYEDASGKRIMDFCSSQFNLSLGYQHPVVLAKIRAQLEDLAYAPANFAIDVKAQLLEVLNRVMPDEIDRFFFTLGGADAIENALKIARLYTGRARVVSRYRSYHGATLGALSTSGDPRRIPFSRLGSDVIRIMDPFCSHCPFGQSVEVCATDCAQHVEEVIRYEGPDTIAAVLVEPVTGSSGAFSSPKDYLPRLREICDRYGILLICDEIACGLGRTGEWLASQHWQVVPDIAVLSKGLTNGYSPLGAVCVSGKVASFFDRSPFVCGLTAGAHPLGCAAAVACLSEYEENDIPGRVRRLGEIQGRRLHEMEQRFAHVAETRNLGLLGVVELQPDSAEDGNPGGAWNRPVSEDGMAARVSFRLEEVGLAVISRWNWIFVAPPLNIEEHELRLGLSMLEEALDVGR